MRGQAGAERRLEGTGPLSQPFKVPTRQSLPCLMHTQRKYTDRLLLEEDRQSLEMKLQGHTLLPPCLKPQQKIASTLLTSNTW